MRNQFSIIISLCLIITSIINLSCKKADWYDEKTSRSQAVPATLADLKALIDNADILNTITPALGEWGSDGHFANMALLPLLGINAINSYTWSREKPYTGVIDWTSNNGGGYVRVFYSNFVLEELNKIKPLNEEEQNVSKTIKAQALFTRSRTFFELSQIFAPVYNSTSASTDLSIPLRLESDINIPSKHSTVKETYDQIINDLITAKNLIPANDFPTTPYLKSRATKTSIYALLAKVYLTIDDFTNAGLYADSSLQTYSELIDYNSLNSALSVPVPTFNSEVILHTTMAAIMNPAFMFIDSNLYDLYDINDLRKTVFFNANGGRSAIRFKGSYDGRGNVFSGLATDEIYLIRAECNARKGNATTAMTDLNTLLLKRWKSGTFIPLTAINSDDALSKILIERRKELLFRGIRWSDLRRLNKEDRFKIILSRTYAGRNYVLEPNSFRYTFPIPDDVIQMTGLQQNTGWE